MGSKKHRSEAELGKMPIVKQAVSQISVLPASYADFLADLKTRIRSAQAKAALSANRELILLYWEIGRRILERQKQEGWGTKVIDRLAADLRQAFPDMKGFSPRNLIFMRALSEAYPSLSLLRST